MTEQEKIEFFEKNHYLCIPAALTPEEVAAVNAAMDRDREQFPRLWSKGNRSQSAQCLLSMPEADFLMRHPSFFGVASHVFDEDICFEEFSIMIRAGNQEKGSIEGWHRDSSPNPEHRLRIKALSAIYYMTDVDETTPRYSLIPASAEIAEVTKVNEDPEIREGEIDMVGPAGTVVLVNAGIWHCGKWGHSPRERRTVHIYYGQSSTPNLSNHTLYPRRLWDTDDPDQQRFYSKLNDLTRETIRDYCPGREV